MEVSRRSFIGAGAASLAVACNPEPTERSGQTVLAVLTADGHTLTYGTAYRNGRWEPFVIAVDGVQDNQVEWQFWMFRVNGLDISEPPHEFVVPPQMKVEAVLVHWKEVITANS